MHNIQATPENTVPLPDYNFSEVHEVIQDNPTQLIQALDASMYLMCQNLLPVAEQNRFFSLKQLRDELLKAVHKIDLS